MNGSLRSRIIGFVVVAVLTGCTAPIGRPLPTNRIARLTRGVSTPQDVLLTLGEPRGSGAARNAAMTEPLVVWSYEHTELEHNTMRLRILLIFFQKEKYNGYLWFSNDQLGKLR